MKEIEETSSFQTASQVASKAHQKEVNKTWYSCHLKTEEAED